MKNSKAKRSGAISQTVSRREFLRMSTIAAGTAAFGMPNWLRAKGANEKLNVAFIGMGWMGKSRLKEIFDCDVNIVAICDVDEKRFDEAREIIGARPIKPAFQIDYREVLRRRDVDAVVVSTPDHWHAPIVKAAFKARKHIFCEKPLAHTISENRELRELSRKSKVVTQTGNQGSASNELRRALELVQGGAIGQVREIHAWVPGAGCHPGRTMPEDSDPVPEGLHWDAWLGPAPYRPFKKDYYHPWNWRGWYDFGNGIVADFGCHHLNLPVRALKLGYPGRVEGEGEFMGLPTYPGKTRLRFDFPQRGELPPVTLWWYDGGRKPSEEVIPTAMLEHFGEIPRHGLLMLGDNGFTFGDPWKCAEYIKLNDEKKMSGILKHQATREIPESLPRSPGHLKEWVDACRGKGPVFSDFETGGLLTEISLAGVIALRLGKPLQWDGQNMRAANAPEARQFVEAKYRKGWKF